MVELTAEHKARIEEAAKTAATKTAQAMLDGFKEVGAPAIEPMRDCMTGCGAGCGVGCGIGCGLTSPTGPVGTGLAMGTGLTSGGAAGWAVHG
jgi:hypothetical protein